MLPTPAKISKITHATRHFSFAYVGAKPLPVISHQNPYPSSDVSKGPTEECSDDVNACMVCTSNAQVVSMSCFVCKSQLLFTIRTMTQILRAYSQIFFSFQRRAISVITIRRIIKLACGIELIARAKLHATKSIAFRSNEDRCMIIFRIPHPKRIVPNRIHGCVPNLPLMNGFATNASIAMSMTHMFLFGHCIESILLIRAPRFSHKRRERIKIIHK
jgi:hypothetical protein